MNGRLDAEVARSKASKDMGKEQECPRQPTGGASSSDAPAPRTTGDSLPPALSLPTPGEASIEERIRAILAKPYWDYEEASLVLHMAVKTLRNMKYRREISFTLFGGKVYFPRQIILAELRHNTVHCPMHPRSNGRATA